MARHDGRADDGLRRVEIIPDYLDNPLGSALIHVGRTRVLCTASVDDRVPPFLNGTGEGWVTGEYSMIPAATDQRGQREISRGRPSGRTMEIQRLIGRAMRSIVERTLLGERTLWIDCEVLQADGGTRTAAITGGFTAMCLAIDRVMRRKKIGRPPLIAPLAAVSVGIVEQRPLLDLDYVEDSAAEVDMNVVRTGDGRYIEVQGTGESAPFPRERLDEMLDLADRGIEQLLNVQREVLGDKLERVLIP